MVILFTLIRVYLVDFLLWIRFFSLYGACTRITYFLYCVLFKVRYYPLPVVEKFLIVKRSGCLCVPRPLKQSNTDLRLECVVCTQIICKIDCEFLCVDSDHCVSQELICNTCAVLTFVLVENTFVGLSRVLGLC